MSEITEDFESFLKRITQKLVIRLVATEGNEPTLINQINMTARLIGHFEQHQRTLVSRGTSRDEESHLDKMLHGDDRPDRPYTWKEVGQALGVSGQAAHRKYARKPLNPDGHSHDESSASD
ncbi:hypothetical protein [Streptosporangium pseudovulgare]|uniref:AsnC family protein n=1 Tax=Streptosporangium pseudovulgare TaxID=35765 RepID=A0ABQ2RG36_9ACTN|nr:hypothetical protein [Streptosporangium pseudovulgare]GGQ25229.1 hypothetical protein GCM10010140_64430 [Streptosporangium pseudovulgare]